MSNAKECTRCGKTLPLTEFGKHRLTKDGLAYQCKECGKARAKAYRASPMGVFIGLKGRQTFYRRHEDKREKPFQLERDSFLEWYANQIKECHYCGISQEDLALIKDSQLRKVHRLTIDCKENDWGYFLENMVLSCNRCNAIKGDFFTYEEMLHIGKEHIAPKWDELLTPSTGEFSQDRFAYGGPTIGIPKDILRGLATTVKNNEI
jgi:hypothetical protein